MEILELEPMQLLLMSLALAFGVSFVCSLYEATLLSLTPTQIANISQKSPKMGAIWEKFKDELDRPIGVILFLNTAAHTIGATVAGAQFQILYGEKWVTAFGAVFTYLMLQFTEILPKTLGVRYNQQLAFYLAMPLLFLTKALSPFLDIIHFINKPFESKDDDTPPATLEEIKSLANLASMRKMIGKHEEKIIGNAARLSRTPARAAMIPAEQVTFISTSQSITDAMIVAHMDPHTRFPVCEEDDHDRILGYINFKELIYRLRTNPNDPSIRGIIRPVRFATPDETCSDLLKAFVGQHVHMAIVQEGGHTLGLVTLEDIVEEMVGELEDEFDRLPQMFHSLVGGTWMIGGGFPAAQLPEKLECAVLSTEGYQSNLSNWIIARMGRLPELNEIYTEGKLQFHIRRIRRGKVFEVAVRKEG